MTTVFSGHMVKANDRLVLSFFLLYSLYDLAIIFYILPEEYLAPLNKHFVFRGMQFLAEFRKRKLVLRCMFFFVILTRLDIC